MIRNCVAFLPIVIAAGCAAPFSDFQSARIVPKGKVEVTPSFSAVTFTEDGDTEHLQDVYGAQVAFGAGEVSEVRVAFARVDFVDEDGGFNVFGFGPKWRIVRDHMAGYLPVGFAFGEDIEVSETWAVHPTVIFSGRLHRVVEVNPSVKVLLPLAGGAEEIRLAFNLGFGISNNLDVWALRPEIGIMVNPGEEGFLIAYSVGMSLIP